MQPVSDSEFANRFRIVSRMADDLAHEIKNPLNSMVINIEVLRSRAKKGDLDGVTERAAVLESEVRRLNGLIDSMLKLLRPEKNPTDDFYIDTLLDELGSLVGIQAKLARRRFHHLPIGNTTAVRARRDAVRFALLSILGAELDAVSGDNSGATLNGTCDGTTVTIRIAVDGCVKGEPAAARNGAVETARGLVEDAGGSVSVESSEDESERIVTVSLPQAR